MTGYLRKSMDGIKDTLINVHCIEKLALEGCSFFSRGPESEHHKVSSVDKLLAVGDDICEVIAPVLDLASFAITRKLVSTGFQVLSVCSRMMLRTHKLLYFPPQRCL